MKLLDWTWCILQTLFGLAWTKISKGKKTDDGYYIVSDKWGGSLSMGKYIFLCETHAGDETVFRHEQGHTKQSYILGPLYLFVIALPSFLWAVFYKIFGEDIKATYFDFYTEKWADKLSGIER